MKAYRLAFMAVTRAIIADNVTIYRYPRPFPGYPQVPQDGCKGRMPSIKAGNLISDTKEIYNFRCLLQNDILVFLVLLLTWQRQLFPYTLKHLQ